MSKDNSEIVSQALANKAAMLFGDLFDSESKKINAAALNKAIEIEQEAVRVAQQLMIEVPPLVESMRDSFWQELYGINEISEEEKEELQNLFGQNVIRHIEVIPNVLYSNLKEGKGVLFNGMMNDRVIDALDGIIEFKNSIDSRYPGLSDVLIKVASAAITAAVITVSPAAGLALKSSGVMEMTQDFLKTENLQETRTKLKTSLDEFEKDKELKAIKARADKTTEIAEEVGVAARVLNRIGFSDEALNAIAEDVQRVPAYKEFIEEMTKYTGDIIPENEKQISENMKTIKEKMVEVMEQNEVHKEVISDMEKRMDERFKEVEKLLQEGLDPKKNFLEKAIVQQQGAQKFLEVSGELSRDLAQSVPDKKDLQKAVMNAVADEAVKKLSGPVDNIQRGLKDSKVKEMMNKEMKQQNMRFTVQAQKTKQAVEKVQEKPVGRER